MSIITFISNSFVLDTYLTAAALILKMFYLDSAFTVKFAFKFAKYILSIDQQTL